MRIAFFIPSLLRCAPNIVAADIIKGLTDSHEVSLFYFDNLKSNDLIKFDCKVEKIDFFEKIDFSQFDIVHSMGFRPDLFLCLNKFKISSSKCKMVTTCHSDYDKDLYDIHGLKGFLLAVFWWLLGFTFDARVFINSHQIRRLSFFKLLKYNYIINNGFEPKDIKYQNNDKRFDNAVLFCGKIRKIKGIDILLDAILLMEDVELHIAGSGNGKFYEDFLRKLKSLNTQRIKFLGHVKNMDDIYNKYKILVVPSRSEGFGFVVLEGVSNSLKVICNDIPPFRELFSEIGVEFYKKNSPEDLSKKIDYFLKQEIKNTNPEDLKIFSKEKMVKNYIKVYSDLLSKK